MILLRALMESKSAQFEAMSERERYVFLLLFQYRNPYVWGKELPNGADCSGAVCFALAGATGKWIRTTADGLLKKFFTLKNPGVEELQAVFFVTRYDRQHGNRLAKSGEAVHVAGIVAEGIAMNVVEPRADLRLISSLRHSYELMGCEILIRGLDRKALVEADKEGSDLFGLDTEFGAYFEKKADIW